VTSSKSPDNEIAIAGPLGCPAAPNGTIHSTSANESVTYTALRVTTRSLRNPLPGIATTWTSSPVVAWKVRTAPAPPSMPAPHTRPERVSWPSPTSQRPAVPGAMTSPSPVRKFPRYRAPSSREPTKKPWPLPMAMPSGWNPAGSGSELGNADARAPAGTPPSSAATRTVTTSTMLRRRGPRRPRRRALQDRRPARRGDMMLPCRRRAGRVDRSAGWSMLGTATPAPPGSLSAPPHHPSSAELQGGSPSPATTGRRRTAPTPPRAAARGTCRCRSPGRQRPLPPGRAAPAQRLSHSHHTTGSRASNLLGALLGCGRCPEDHRGDAWSSGTSQGSHVNLRPQPRRATRRRAWPL
jgi:hypothetical protein